LLLAAAAVDALHVHTVVAACRYSDHQALLSVPDSQLAQQAATIQALQQQLREATTGAAGRSHTQHIQELQRQVAELQAALNSRQPPAAAAVAGGGGGSGESAALAAAQQRVASLEAELEAQQLQQEHSLHALQQQYEALKLRLEEQNTQLQVGVRCGAAARVVWARTSITNVNTRF
jgi:DNA repair exonuclease SbcCD ATPase subunit